jgi:NADP-dependent 3-hydroxy acid dehydrogenase YdfG
MGAGRLHENSNTEKGMLPMTRRIGPDDQSKMALKPADTACSIVFALDRPAHVQIAEMMILPVNRY